MAYQYNFNFLVRSLKLTTEVAAGAVALHPPPQFLLCAEMSNQGSAGAADRQILGGTKKSVGPQ